MGDGDSVLVTGLIATVSDRVHSAIVDGSEVRSELERLQNTSSDNPVGRNMLNPKVRGYGWKSVQRGAPLGSPWRTFLLP
jgi:hypothetical protein